VLKRKLERYERVYILGVEKDGSRRIRGLNDLGIKELDAHSNNFNPYYSEIPFTL